MDIENNKEYDDAKKELDALLENMDKTTMDDGATALEVDILYEAAKEHIDSMSKYMKKYLKRVAD